MAILFEYATTMPGYPNLRDTYYTKLKRVKRDFIVTPKTAAAAGQPVKILAADDPIEEGLINITNISNHEIGQGRGYMPTLGFLNPLAYFPDHFGILSPEKFPKDNMFNKLFPYAWENDGACAWRGEQGLQTRRNGQILPLCFPGEWWRVSRYCV
jgi:hypothetical protein